MHTNDTCTTISGEPVPAGSRHLVWIEYEHEECTNSETVNWDRSHSWHLPTQEAAEHLMRELIQYAPPPSTGHLVVVSKQGHLMLWCPGCKDYYDEWRHNEIGDAYDRRTLSARTLTYGSDAKHLGLDCSWDGVDWSEISGWLECRHCMNRVEYPLLNDTDIEYN